ncbi:MAG: 2-oxoglutarate dehydrogenase E1 component [Mariprofundaceae bacterium]
MGNAESAVQLRHRLEQEADLDGASLDYVASMYHRYKSDPESVVDEWAARFSDIDANSLDDHEKSHSDAITKIRKRMLQHEPMHTAASENIAHREAEYSARALYLIQAYRTHGHLHATLDDLHLNTLPPNPELELSYYGLVDADLPRKFPTGDLTGPAEMTLQDIMSLLKDTYCGSIGPEFMYINDSAQRHWIQKRLESIRSKQRPNAEQKIRLFDLVMRSEEFERFLHTRYVGQKRFSLEGGEGLIVMLDHLIQHVGLRGVKEVTMGMAHRGRLNVLANILNKATSDIFAEFEGVHVEDADFGSGDVKYHLGFSSDIPTKGGTVHLSLAFNPSHLEIITPVVLGSVRARQCRRGDKLRKEVMAVVIHGDAAFAGQGVVAESLNLSQLSGFRTGGAIHIVVNNQIGFTTNPFDARSSIYCTDIAKMVQAPVFHVNGNDPEAIALVVELAAEFRQTFHQDVVIDLVCYRRHGHNESDSPSVTQPVMYRQIEGTPSVQQLYRERLIADGVFNDEEADAMVNWYRGCLDRVRRDQNRPPPTPVNSLQGRWQEYAKDAPEIETGVPLDRLTQLVRQGHNLPSDFSPHSKVEKIFAARVRMIDGDSLVDWGCAEVMAYATLINEGRWLRLSGQDSGRGTFFHRHVTVYDQVTGKKFIPLRQVGDGDLTRLIIVDSMLSEEAVMAFEYGYSVAEPRALVIWEAQYGDFANNAQVVIDQFICAGESKWKRMSGLVLWLPHGYEGQGAEHSSARLERYLQLCAENNMQVVCPTTPAQLFHLFRRQSLIRTRKPLIMMAPKSMLRQKLSFSSVNELATGSFQPLLAEQDSRIESESCQRLLICSGKVYYDLLAARSTAGILDIAIVRLERLYPFPAELLTRETAHYSCAIEVVWVQEEPENQGAWYQIKHHLKRCLLPQQKVTHIARDAAAAPAVGSLKRHQEQQQSIVNKALNIREDKHVE